MNDHYLIKGERKMKDRVNSIFFTCDCGHPNFLDTKKEAIKTCVVCSRKWKLDVGEIQNGIGIYVFKV